MSNEIKENLYRIFDEKLKEEICEIKKIRGKYRKIALFVI
jgi:hypothetical protein